jgi:hypothetical protein
MRKPTILTPVRIPIRILSTILVPRESIGFHARAWEGGGEGIELVRLEKFLIGGQVLEIEVRI